MPEIITPEVVDKNSAIIHPNGFDYERINFQARDYIRNAAIELKTIAKRSAEDIIRMGSILVDIKQQIKHGLFQEWYEKELGWSSDTIGNLMNVSKYFGEIPKISEFEQSALYLLAKRSTPDPARQEAIELAEDGEKISHAKAKEIIAKYKDDNGQESKKGPTFNQTNENIDWAPWTWNPVTGCKHDCLYCYARDIANRFYKEKFEPTFRKYRLRAPQNTQLPQSNRPEDRNVFVCSMADLFGDWVPQEWIDAVLETVIKFSQWNYIFLTKNPGRLTTIQWPDNAWVGTTVDIQARVKPAEEAFKEINAKVKFISCEPLSGELIFSDLDIFDWVIIGARSRSSRVPAMQPKRQWLQALLGQAWNAECMIYCKPNLKTGIKEYP